MGKGILGIKAIKAINPMSGLWMGKSDNSDKSGDFAENVPAAFHRFPVYASSTPIERSKGAAASNLKSNVGAVWSSM